ncbi:MAG: NAD(P)-binding protein, partial [Pseudomonadota bacterium]
MTKQKIAVIGGGVGAITATFAITEQPDWQDRFEITLYQRGWRLGGKGASGRNMEQGARIEEHGLHVWAGFYENAFRNMRACYEQLVEMGLRAPNAPLSTLDKAFKPLNHLFLAEHIDLPNTPSGWRPWLIDLPKNDQVPGTATTSPTPFSMFVRMIQIAIEFLEKGELSDGARKHLGPEKSDELRSGIGKLHSFVGGLPTQAHKHTAEHQSLLVDLIQDAQKMIHALETPAHLADDATRRLLILLDISFAFAHGMAAHQVFTKGYDVLDQWEFTEWLALNGASEVAQKSTILRSCYDFVFGYPHGRALAGNAGAGTAIRAMSRLVFTYSGAIFFKMQAGMGDTIFGPYYEVLKARGVTFKYFNAVKALRLDDHGTRIAALDMVEQAELKQFPYEPLVTVKDLPCWPSTPLWDQIVDGASMKERGVDFEDEGEPLEGRHYTLHAGTDFDQIILGASIGSLPDMTAELAGASPRWRRMLEDVKTVATQAAQFWLTKDQDDLGWRALVAEHNSPESIPDGPLNTIITGFAEPLDTWADMTHLLPREDWPEPGPTSIAYFCSPAPDGETLEGFTDKTRKWANGELLEIWPKAGTGDGINPDLFYKRPDASGTGFENQYFRVNMFGSERYVLSETGSVYSRLAPDQSGFENLVLAGDWTRCGLNAGCVEAATMSGISAASTILGTQLLNVGADDIPSDETPEMRAMYNTSTIANAPWPLSGFFARGSMNGWFLFYHMRREDVQALLPAGAYIGQSPMSPPGQHPVGISLCHFHNVRSSFLPGFTRIKPYNEASFAIPFVQTEETQSGWLLYPRRLYVNNGLAVWMGKTFYKMPKEKMKITADDRSFKVLGKNGATLIDSQFQQHSNPTPLANHPAFGAVSSLLNASFLTVGSSGNFRFGNYNLELGHGYAAPVTGRVTVTDGSPGGFPSAEIVAHPLERDHPIGLPGALRIWSTWSLTNPLDGNRMKES